jgi:hypothetical protein
MTGTDPTQFDPESTGTFRVRTLAEANETVERYEVPEGQPVILPVTPPPTYAHQSYVSLVYVGTDGVSRRVDGDHNLISHHDSTDADHRERLILKALLMHALAMLNGEDVS